MDTTLSYPDVLQADTPDEVTEASLSRVWQHMEEGRSWGIISAWRSDQADDPKKNRELNNEASDQLEQDIRSLGYGYFPMKGRWREDTEDGPVWVEERSFFVPNIEKGEIRELGQKYGQDAVVFGESDGPDDQPGDVVLLYMDGREMKISKNTGDDLRPRQIADAYSEVKGHAFAFGQPPGGTTSQVSSSRKVEGYHLRALPEGFAEAMTRQVHPVEDLNERIDRFLAR